MALSIWHVNEKERHYMSIDMKTEPIREIQQHFVLCIVASRDSNVAIDTGDFLKFAFGSDRLSIASGDSRGTHHLVCLHV